MNITDFDPNGTGLDNGNYFGLPITAEESDLVLLSVPWDVTASYGGGSAFGPDAIIGASSQLDLYEPLYPYGWKRGIGTIGIDYSIQDKSIFLREDAKKVMKHLENGGNVKDEIIRRKIEKINTASGELNRKIYEEATIWLRKGKIVGLVGGDHSTPLGLIGAVAAKYSNISILHIDAHADLRRGYEGFTDSHASIMYNVVNSIPGIDKLVQVGLRDLCDAEKELIDSDERIYAFLDRDIKIAGFEGRTWAETCGRIIGKLGDTVYVSFDIDGLSPEYCPHTGTPVPGGLSFDQAVYLIDKIAASGRLIAGFDLCEVAPSSDSEWDANVGARILYKLSNICLKTHLK